MNDVDFFNKNYHRWNRDGGYCAEKYAKYTYQDKEDLVQEGMIVVWLTILNFKWRTSSFLQDRCKSGIFAAYKRGKSIDNHYQNKNRRKHKFSTETLEDFKEGALDKKASPEETAVSSIMLEIFHNLLDKEERTFLRLKLAGYYWKEIMGIMGVGSRSLQDLLHRIKGKYLQVYE